MKILRIRHILFLLSLLFIGHYVYLLSQQSQYGAQRYQKLQNDFATLRNKVGAVENQLAYLKQLDFKLRNLAGIPASSTFAEKKIKNAGLHDPTSHKLPPFDDSLFSIQQAVLDSRLFGLAAETEHQAGELAYLVDYYSLQNKLLIAMPSLWPTKGNISSYFGVRPDPFTGNRAMHFGLDIMANEGSFVIAPASGHVVFVGNKGGYGNMVSIDHGFGVVTTYGHLRRSLVKIGDRVTRGQHFALVGSTGKSTGPHLHYEVRQDGFPVNPMQFLVYD